MIFALLVVMAWSRAPNAQQEAIFAFGPAFDSLQYLANVSLRGEALQHLAGIALGLLAMSVVFVFATSQERLILTAALFALASVGIVVAGLIGTSPDLLAKRFAKFLVLDFADVLPHVNLGLPVAAHAGWINPNALGATALMVLPVNLALAMIPAPPSRWRTAVRTIGWLASAAAVFVVVLTQSRSVWLAATIVLATCVVWRVHSRWARTAAMVVALSAAVAFALWLGGGSARLDKAVLAASESASSRVILWRFAIERFAEAPWLGIGLNQLHVMPSDIPVPNTPLIVSHAHNTVLQVALDLGLLGLVCYLVLQVLLLMRAAAAARNSSSAAAVLAVGAALSLVGVHVFGIADTVALGARVGLFQWLSSGIVLAAGGCNATHTVDVTHPHLQHDHAVERPVTQVAVVVPCRNEAPTITALLDAIANQEVRPDEIVVVDDASTDGTASGLSAGRGSIPRSTCGRFASASGLRARARR